QRFLHTARPGARPAAPRRLFARLPRGRFRLHGKAAGPLHRRAAGGRARMTAEEMAHACAAAMWADDQASQRLGMELTDVGPGRATVTFTVSEAMVNGHGLCHGGYIFTLADSAFAFA